MIGIETENQGKGARHSVTLSRIAKKDKRIMEYYFEDGSHWIILKDGYEYDYGCGTISEPNVVYALAQIRRITRVEE